MVALVKAVLSYVDSNGVVQPLSADTSGLIQISVAQATGASTGTQTVVNDTNADTTILASNASRKGAAIWNDSTAVLYLLVASGTSSATNCTLSLAPGAYYELPITEGGCYTGVVKGIWASDASGAARVTEWT